MCDKLLHAFLWFLCKKMHGPFERPSQGFWATGEKGHLFQGTREQTSKTERKRGAKAILGKREHRKPRF